ncbi:hypothetical protein IEQ_05032 [Bacillus cereus BAG6X1-2]|nr:hypothetical protein IEQ_05032 [Bacillus cereus BAG6X1-2]
MITEFKEATIVLNEEHIKLWLQIHKSILQIAKVVKLTYETVNIHMNKSGFEFVLDGTDVKMTAPYERNKSSSVEKVCYQIEYTRDAIEAHQKLGTKQLFIQIDGEM